MARLQLKQAFLRYFQQQQGHLIVPSASLLPRDDPSLFFINAGMAPLKAYFLATAEPPAPRLVSAQLCLRAGGKHNDLDAVGQTARHHTLFEMLGNFSFGDYGKREAIEMAWYFLTKECKLPEDRLSVTVHTSDNEAVRIWTQLTGLNEHSGRIRRLEENMWAMGDTGPCGPCSEIFYDQRQMIDGEQHLELWNLVFMSHQRHNDGSTTALQRLCIDTGMGLERLAGVLGNRPSNYDIDMFRILLDAVRDLLQKQGIKSEIMKERMGLPAMLLSSSTDQSYSIGLDHSSEAVALKVIVDHLRSAVFLLNEGILPSKAGRGHILRRIIRRAVSYGYKLGFVQPFLADLVPALLLAMPDYVYLFEGRLQLVVSTLRQEEALFYATLSKGIKVLDDAIVQQKPTAKLYGDGLRQLSGETAAQLYTSYGFPLDLTELYLKDKRWIVDTAGFEQHMNEWRQRSKDSWAGSGVDAIPEEVRRWNLLGIKNRFIDQRSNKQIHCKGTVLAVHEQGGIVWAVLDNCPFYAKGGGQVGDQGYIELPSGRANVLTCLKVYDGCSAVAIENNDSSLDFVNELRVGTVVTAMVDCHHRMLTATHHTATHLLHAALRAILGNLFAGLAQAGSYVGPNSLRFDFQFPSALKPEQLSAVEKWVNDAILSAAPVTINEMSKDDAMKRGAMALFEDTYGDVVRVVEVPDYSIELCGGTHVGNISALFPFKIISEGSVSAGTRRIEAVAGLAAFKWLSARNAVIERLASHLGISSAKVENHVKHLSQSVAQLEEQLTQARLQAMSFSSCMFQYRGVAAQLVLIEGKAALDNTALRAYADSVRESQAETVHFICYPSNGVIAVTLDPARVPLSAKRLLSEFMPQLTAELSLSNPIRGGGKDNLAICAVSDVKSRGALYSAFKRILMKSANVT